LEKVEILNVPNNWGVLLGPFFPVTV
jgi:hypothetical protein